jgi:3-dehydroquinate synthase
MVAIPSVEGFDPAHHWLPEEVETDDRVGVCHQSVALSWEYPVHFTHDAFSWENLALVRAITRREPQALHRLFVVVDRAAASVNPMLVDDVRRYVDVHGERLTLAGPPLILDAGEGLKSDPEFPSRLRQLLEERALDDRSFVVSIGGGALQDAVGYAVATEARGVRIVRVPTTVLAQVDAAVGVRSGINVAGRKDALATIAAPWAVIEDFDFLRTLPKSVALAGTAEAIKIALARDASFFGWIEEHADDLRGGDLDCFEALVRRAAGLHLDELGRIDAHAPRPSELGHGTAHAIESATRFVVPHADAVAVGLVVDVLGSVLARGLGPGAVERILALHEALGLPTWHDALLDDRVQRGAAQRSGTLLDAIGRGVSVDHIDDAVLGETVRRLRSA